MQDFDIHYLTCLKNFFPTYMGVINKIEPLNSSATPRLASLLHFPSNNSSKVAGIHQIAVQPTSVSRRHSGISSSSC